MLNFLSALFKRTPLIIAHKKTNLQWVSLVPQLVFLLPYSLIDSTPNAIACAPERAAMHCSKTTATSDENRRIWGCWRVGNTIAIHFSKPKSNLYILARAAPAKKTRGTRSAKKAAPSKKIAKKATAPKRTKKTTTKKAGAKKPVKKTAGKRKTATKKVAKKGKRSAKKWTWSTVISA